MKVSPSVLAADFCNLSKEIKKIEKYVDYLHLDIMDGNFVPNISFGIDVTKSIANITNVLLDVHLMVLNPEKYVSEYILYGAKIITIHYESICEESFEKIYEIVKKQNQGIMLGLAISPNTRYDVIKKYIGKIDLVLIMSVEPGFYGQKFIDESEQKIKQVKDLIKELNSKILIEIDGGINEEVLNKINEVDIVVAGKYIFKNNNYKKAILKLKSI